MLRKTVIVLLTAAALTGGLTAVVFARGGGGGGGGHGGTGQTVTALAVGHGGGAVTGSHFGHNPFGHHGREHHRIVIFRYPRDWSDSDYDGAPTDAYPPPAAAVQAPEAEQACHRTSETFNVPAAGGGTREITVIGCP
jgi:hypothetical protein